MSVLVAPTKSNLMKAKSSLDLSQKGYESTGSIKP